MTILQLITRRQYRGAEVFAAQLSQRLVQRGHRVIFAGLYPAPPKALAPEGLEHVDLNGRRQGILPDFSLFQKIAQIIRKEQVDLVQANASDNLKYAVLSRKLFSWKAPVIYRNASVLSHWTRSSVHRRTNRWLLNQCEAIACVSRETMRDLREQVGVNAMMLHHLPIGTPITTQNGKAPEKEYLASWTTVHPSDLVIMHIGSFSPEKNHQALLRIFRAVKEQISRPVKLILVGEGPLRPRIEEEVRRQGLSGQVITLGQRSDIQQLLSVADLFLLPSLIEGTPAVLLEASAQGLPSVAYDVGAVRECFPEAVHAEVLTPKNDEAAFVHKAIRLLEQTELKKHLGRQVRQYVEEFYDIEKITDQFEALYERFVIMEKAGNAPF